MRLHFLDSHNPRNVTLSLNQRDPTYTISTPFKVIGRTSTIHKITKSENKRNEESKNEPMAVSNRTVKVGEIQWQIGKPCRLVLGDHPVVGVDEYFSKVGFLWGRRDRVFRAPDGREYTWKFKGPVLELYTNGESSTLVASFQPLTLGRWGPTKLSVLIIFPEWEHIADTIVVTFVYIQSLRNS